MTLVIINIINHACVTGGAPPRVKATDCLPSLKGGFTRVLSHGGYTPCNASLMSWKILRVLFRDSHA